MHIFCELFEVLLLDHTHNLRVQSLNLLMDSAGGVLIIAWNEVVATAPVTEVTRYDENGPIVQEKRA